MSDYRPEFAAALEIFAAVSEHMDAQGIRPPILVGGAAAELYSGSTLATGDFDVIARQDAFEAALRSHGFVRPSGPGMLTRGWIHPDLQLGFEIVGSTLLDGLADRARALSGQLAGGMTRVGAAEKAAIARLGVRVIDASAEGWGIVNHDLFLSNAEVQGVIRRSINGTTA